MRTYSELITLPTFEERFLYLKLSGSVGRETFGAERYLNQAFYRSKEWRKIRNDVFVRDLGCDLACEGYEILGSYEIHHMNPISVVDLERNIYLVMDPEYLITTSPDTHKKITYGVDNFAPRLSMERHKYDTCPWRKE